MKSLLALLPALAAAALRTKAHGAVVPPSIHSMEETVAELLQRRAEPRSQELMRQVQTLLRDMVLPHLLRQHRDLQAQLDGAHRSFENCKASRVDLAAVEALSAEHQRCRQREVKLAAQNATCHSELASLAAAQKERCRTFDALHQIPEASCVAHGSENATTWYARVVAELRAAQARLARAESACTTAQHASGNKMAQCAGLEEDFKALESCAAPQQLVDQAACDLQEGALANCSAEAACYEQRRSGLDALLGHARAQEATFKVELHALLRMECMLETFGDSDSQKAAIDSCKDKDYDTQNVSFTYPSIPASDNCSVPGDLKPGSRSYEQRFLASPPSAPRPPLPCAASCCAAPSATVRGPVLPPTFQAVPQCFSFRAAYGPLMLPGSAPTQEESAEDCQRRCKQTPGCGLFSFGWDGSCFVTKPTARQFFQPGVVAGPMDCLGAPSDCYGYNKKFLPELEGYTVRSAASEEECQKRCFDTVGCGHWVLWWDLSCHLAGAAASMSYEPGTVSGPSQCTLPTGGLNVSHPKRMASAVASVSPNDLCNPD